VLRSFSELLVQMPDCRSVFLLQDGVRLAFCLHTKTFDLFKEETGFHIR
jgi:hypothetical protein